MNDAPRSGHTQKLRQMLKARRLDLGLSARAVGVLIAEIAGVEVVTSQSVYQWEKMERNPPIDKYAAWARALGWRLIVDLDTSGEEDHAPSVRLQHPEVARMANLIDSVEDDDRRNAIIAAVSALIPS